MTEVHITADSDCWTGASTRALHAARRAPGNAVVITAGDASMVDRICRSGVEGRRCSMGGFLGALNLSRVLRGLEGDSFRVFVHSPEILPAVENALRLVGRQEPVQLCPVEPITALPPVEVERPAADAVPLYMWLGNITAGCGLADLIEALGRRDDPQWRLRVVGQGNARIVSPILKRCKALGIADRIEWAGYSSNPYEQMNGVTAGIVTQGPDSIVTLEFAAAGIPVITSLP